VETGRIFRIRGRIIGISQGRIIQDYAMSGFSGPETRRISEGQGQSRGGYRKSDLGELEVRVRLMY
jgi:hypothetical protein